MSRRIRLLICLSILLPWIRTADTQAPDVRIVAKPDVVYLERSESGQHLNFTDFRRLLGAKPIIVKTGQVDTGDIVESILR